jgi:Heterokaryon incompatibility protein (HET)
MIQELPYASLPKIIQDAILVTRQVGLRYLRIDALCIIQDSESSAAFRIAAMDDVYSNCTICIGTAVAKSVAEGVCGLDRSQALSNCRLTARQV